ncbi:MULTISPECIES: hypothetical protein [unclassified Bradyrhizobium]|uniref:hypothetical protein n=1 Tax=unclassified Bradyrhizobium TaxID=2631580 RepID=UPI001CD604DD|nr:MULTISPECIES: hypothetical protein [unclassified Bradyrhizobium]
MIRLGEADANVAHILRNHFSVVERLVRTPKDEQSREWQKAVAQGAIIGLATTELESPASAMSRRVRPSRLTEMATIS